MSKIRRIILETAAEKLLELVKETLKGDREFKGRYSLPYAYADDDWVEFIVYYKVTKIKLWKSNDPECIYEGTIYVNIDKVLVGFEGTDDWERVGIYDIPQWSEDSFKESIQDDLNMYPICVDVDYDKVS